MLGFDGAAPRISDETAAVIDAEIRRIVDECFARALAELGEHREQLDALAAALLREESLGEDEILKVTGLSAASKV